MLRLATTNLKGLAAAVAQGPRQPASAVRALIISPTRFGWVQTSQARIRRAATRADVDVVVIGIETPLWGKISTRLLAKLDKVWPVALIVHRNRAIEGQIRRWIASKRLDLAQYDVVCVDTFIYANAFARVKDRFNFKLMIWSDTLVAIENDVIGLSSARRRMVDKAIADERVAAHKTDRFLAWTRAVAAGAITHYGFRPEDVAVLPPPIEMPTAPPQRRLHQRGRLPRLCFVGNDWERKGGDLLLRVHQESFSDRCELHIAGSVPSDPAARNVVWLGPVDHECVLHELMPGSDIFVMPTRWDTFGMVLAEAAGAGMPAIATRLPGIADIIEDGVTGLLIDVDDAAGLKHAIERLLDNEPERLAMGEAARERAVRLFNSDMVLDRYFDEAVALARSVHVATR